MTRFKSLIQPRQAVLFAALILTAAFGAACGTGTSKSTSPSSSSAPGATSGAAFEGEITSTMFAGTGQEVRYSVKGSRTRIETGSSQAGATPATVMLVDYTATTQNILFPQTKTYMSMNLGETVENMGKYAGADMGNDATNDFPKMTSTGKTETVAGVTCHHWLVGDKMDICLAQGMGYFSGGSGGILDNLKNLALRDKFKAQLDANPEFAKFSEGGAFPLKMTLTENGQEKILMEVTRIERKSLDDSLFTVPADYKKMEMPKLPGLPEMKR